MLVTESKGVGQGLSAGSVSRDFNTHLRTRADGDLCSIPRRWWGQRWRVGQLTLLGAFLASWGQLPSVLPPALQTGCHQLLCPHVSLFSLSQWRSSTLPQIQTVDGRASIQTLVLFQGHSLPHVQKQEKLKDTERMEGNLIHFFTIMLFSLFVRG